MTDNIKLGLKENRRQFALLVLVNAFVGGMIGMERSIFPQFAEQEFAISSKTAILSFITAFGFTKAIANYYTGKLANNFGRKRLLLFGWIMALPVPFLLIYAPSWSWVIVANMFLGISQGFTWSSTVVMKIDLVGEKDRGLAMGLNEFAGYFSIGLVAFLTGYIANKYGVTPYPFYLGIFMAVSGLVISAIGVKDTQTVVHKESALDNNVTLKNVFIETTIKNKTLSTVTQAGLVNNLNDGMLWGLLPVILFSLSYNSEHTGIITAIYPAVWGVGQLFTGKMSDHYSKKAMLFWGMLLQGVAILAIPFITGFLPFAVVSALLGLGTALVYPTFLSTIAQATSPGQRAESIGTFRFWRDMGYPLGAIISGIAADRLGLDTAVWIIGGLTIISSLIIRFRMPEKTKAINECIEATAVKEAIRSRKKIKIIDVRSSHEYGIAHIPEAINISLQELQDKLKVLDKNFLFVTVCAKGGGRSSEGAKILKASGLNALWLCGGTNAWLHTEMLHLK